MSIIILSDLFCILAATDKNPDIFFVFFVEIDVVIKQADWDTSKTREKLRRDIETHTLSVRSAKLSELSAYHEVRFTEIFCRIFQNFQLDPFIIGNCVSSDFMYLSSGLTDPMTYTIGTLFPCIYFSRL